MSRGFYAKLAISNIGKNKKTYIPYILTCIGMVMMFYIIGSLTYNSEISSLHGGKQIQSLLYLAMTVIGIFAVVFLFYTNNFLMKRRKKEFGLFNILGMEKRHICKVMFLETVFVYIMSLAGGLVGGILFSKLAQALLFCILHFEVPLTFEILPNVMGITALLFSAIFLLVLLNSYRQVRLSNPVELLKGASAGEKEPKTNWVVAILGVLTLGTGYTMAVTVKQPLEAFFMFLVAVILVVIGTYCCFVAGSVALLKLLKKNKRYYYKSNHFISVSGMIYRMKQNGVGLANICILSICVLVMISSTVSLYAGGQDMLRAQYPRNIIINTDDYSPQEVEQVDRLVEHTLETYGEQAQNTLRFRNLSFSALERDGAFYADKEKVESSALEIAGNLGNLCFIPLEDYNRMTGESQVLQENEVLVYASAHDFQWQTLQLEGMPEFAVKAVLEDFVDTDEIDNMRIIKNYYVVVRDMGVMETLNRYQAEAYEEHKSFPEYYYGFDLSCDVEKQVDIYNALNAEIETNNWQHIQYVHSAAEASDNFFILYGGLFFMGLFLGILFLFATALIIYYKQITEGYEDRERFQIMQQVGMSKVEVKKYINSQILTVFFLPLITAGVHMCFAFPLISLMLSGLNLTNVAVFILGTVGTFLGFALLYAVVYWLTSKAYYGIVSGKREAA